MTSQTNPERDFFALMASPPIAPDKLADALFAFGEVEIQFVQFGQTEVTLVVTVRHGDREVASLRVVYNLDDLRLGRASPVGHLTARDGELEHNLALTEDKARVVGRRACRYELERRREQMRAPKPPGTLVRAMAIASLVVRDELVSAIAAEGPLVTIGSRGCSWGEKARRHGGSVHSIARTGREALAAGLSMGTYPNELTLGDPTDVGRFPEHTLLIAEDDARDHDVLTALRAFSGEILVVMGSMSSDFQSAELGRLLPAFEGVTKIAAGWSPMGTRYVAVLERRLEHPDGIAPDRAVIDNTRPLTNKSAPDALDRHLLRLQELRCRRRPELLARLEEADDLREDPAKIVAKVERHELEPDAPLLQRLQCDTLARLLAEAATEAERLLGFLAKPPSR